MLNPESSVLIIVDLQEKMVRAMLDKELYIDNAIKLIKGIKALGIPILACEQNPQGLGETIPEVKELLEFSSIPKFSFSCCGEPRFMDRLNELDVKQAIVTGNESHVCVYQTVADLLQMGYEVQVAADAVSSRTEANKQAGIERCRDLGSAISSVEMILFDLMCSAEHPSFKEIQKIVK